MGVAIPRAPGVRNPLKISTTGPIVCWSISVGQLLSRNQISQKNQGKPPETLQEYSGF